MSRYREDSFVLIDFSPCLLRAGQGLYEVFRRPTLEIPACAAVRSSVNAKSWADYLVGPALAEAQRSGEPLELVWPLSTMDSTQMFVKQDDSMQIDQPNNIEPDFVQGVVDWLAVEALLRHILFQALGLPARPLSHHILLAIPPALPLKTHEIFMRLLFENLHLSAIMLADRAMAQMYAYGHQSAVVIDIQDRTTEISIIAENILDQSLQARVHLGEYDCDVYLAALFLQSNPALPSLLSPQVQLTGPYLKDALLRIVRWLKIYQCIQFESVALQLNQRQQAVETIIVPAAAEEEAEEEVLSKAAAQLANRQVNGAMNSANIQPDAKVIQVPHPLNASLPPIAIGQERHRYAEPLFDPSLLQIVPSFEEGAAQEAKEYSAMELERKSASVTEAASQALRALPIDKRVLANQNLVVTGNMATFKGVSQAVTESLARTTVARNIKLAKQPEYFSEFKDRPDLAAFLGCSVLAKLGFSDSKHFYTKSDYSEFGPSLVSTISAAHDGN